MKRRGLHTHYSDRSSNHSSILSSYTVVINLETLELFKGLFEKKIVESFLREETSLARNTSSNRRTTFHCTNSPSVLSIR
jgi:hypothetical protein